MFLRRMSLRTFTRSRFILPIVLTVFLAGCATSGSIGAIDAKLMARNFLHGRTDVKRAPGVGTPNVPYRLMTDFQTETVTGKDLPTPLPSERSFWAVRIRVTEGKYLGTHRVVIDPETKQVVAWNPNVS